MKIKEYSIVDLNAIKETKEKILKLYEQKGFFLAQVKHTLVFDPKTNEADLTFQIEELDKVKIRKIQFIGNHIFSDEELKGVMATKERGLFSWLTKTDNYQEEILKGDLEGLTYFYHIKGYIQVKIDPPQVTISPDKKWIYVSIPIEEGDQYQVGMIDYAGDLLFSKDELRKEKKIEPNTQFNRDLLRQEVLRLADKYKDEGYAFANVNVRSDIHEKTKKVDLTFDFEKGQKVMIGAINVSGNSQTRDKVIRRELSIHEGDLYNETQLRKSIDKVRALGYFSEVTYTKPQGSSLNMLDIDISVKERSTGALTMGAGWSTIEGIIGNAQISHNNLFGRGQTVALNAQLAGKSNTIFSLSFTEPYTLDTHWSSGFDAYNVKTHVPDAYDEKKSGGDVRAGHPIGENMSTYGTYKLENITLDNVAAGREELIQGAGVISSVIGTFIYDTRNNRFEPTNGYYDSLSCEFAGVGGDHHFIKPVFNSRFYTPSFWDGTFRVNFEAGALARTTSKVAPTSERFYLGGVNSLRGYQPFSLGPKKLDKNGKEVLVGGDRELFSNIEYEIPLVASMGVKGVVFYDVGSAFEGLDIGKIRQDVGFGFRWFSPFGPLRVEIGFPILPKEGEKKQVVQFAITPPF
ncbi:MAG: outer membrane protein assembly factor BamA [Deltaproteobacteria bacterium]|nr:outer membrane protein assembly factor BamA [Deltaproteobacteria bacterium]